jgi:hypothetical protein
MGVVAEGARYAERLRQQRSMNGEAVGEELERFWGEVYSAKKYQQMFLF